MLILTVLLVCAAGDWSFRGCRGNGDNTFPAFGVLTLLLLLLPPVNNNNDGDASGLKDDDDDDNGVVVLRGVLDLVLVGLFSHPPHDSGFGGCCSLVISDGCFEVGCGCEFEFEFEASLGKESSSLLLLLLLLFLRNSIRNGSRWGDCRTIPGGSFSWSSPSMPFRWKGIVVPAAEFAAFVLLLLLFAIVVVAFILIRFVSFRFVPIGIGIIMTDTKKGASVFGWLVGMFMSTLLLDYYTTLER